MIAEGPTRPSVDSRGMASHRRLAASTAAFGAATALLARRRPRPGERRGRGVRRRARRCRRSTIAFNLPNLVRSIVADNAICGGLRARCSSSCGSSGREREAWRVAGMVLWTTARAAGGGQRPVHAARRRCTCRLLLYGQDNVVRRPGGHAHADPVPDRGDPGHDRRRHGDPELGADLRRAGVRAGRLEPRDHPGAGAVRPRQAARRGRSRCTPWGVLVATVVPVPDPAAAAARPGHRAWPGSWGSATRTCAGSCG